MTAQRGEPTNLAREHRLSLADAYCRCEPDFCDDNCRYCAAVDPYDPCPADPTEEDE